MAKSRVKSVIRVPLGRSYVLAKVVAGVELAAAEGENQLIDILSIPPQRTGRKHEGNPNTSSAPGEAPAPQSGELRQGVAHTPARVEGSQVVAQIASRAGHAAELELGSDKIEPRPALGRLMTEPVRRKRLIKAFQIGARR